MSKEEVVALVDSEDKILGYKKRSELSDDDCWRIVSICLLNPRGEVLLAQRSFNKVVSPGKWDVSAAGTVVMNDSYIDTAVRELEEELGITGLVLKDIGKVYAKWPDLGWRQSACYTATCDLPLEAFKIQQEEVEQIAWVNIQELLQELSGKKPRRYDYVDNDAEWRTFFNSAK